MFLPAFARCSASVPPPAPVPITIASYCMKYLQLKGEIITPRTALLRYVDDGTSAKPRPDVPAGCR